MNSLAVQETTRLDCLCMHGYFNPLSPKSDQYQNSPFDINAL